MSINICIRTINNQAWQISHILRQNLCQKSDLIRRLQNIGCLYTLYTRTPKMRVPGCRNRPKHTSNMLLLMTPCREITGHPLLCRQRLRDQNVVEVLQNLHKISWKLFKSWPKQWRPAECAGPVGAAFWRPKCRPNPSKFAQNWSKICQKLTKNGVWGRIGSIWQPKDDQGGSQDDFCSQNGGPRAPKLIFRRCLAPFWPYNEVILRAFWLQKPPRH